MQRYPDTSKARKQRSADPIPHGFWEGFDRLYGRGKPIGANMLPALQEEAKKRQVAHLKKGTASPVTTEVEERETGEAAAIAASLVGTGRPSLRAPR